MQRLILHTKKRWIDIADGIRFQVEPMSSAIMTAATQQPDVAEMPVEAFEHRYEVVCRHIAQTVIRAWEGVTLDDEDTPAPVTPDTVAGVMDIPAIRRQFSKAYLEDWLRVGAEKKGLAPLRSGTSAGAPTTATAAEPAATTARPS